MSRKTKFKKNQLVVVTERIYCCGLVTFKPNSVAQVEENVPDCLGDIYLKNGNGISDWANLEQVRPLKRGYESMNARKKFEAGETF